MGEKNVGKTLSNEHKEKISNKNKGKKKGYMSLEHKNNLSQSLKKYHDIRRKTK